MEFTVFHIVVATCLSLLVGAAVFIPLGIFMGKQKKTAEDDSRMPIPPSLRAPFTPAQPAMVQAAPVQTETEAIDDEDDDDEDFKSPFEERLVAEGYECRFMEDDREFWNAAAGQFNFSQPESGKICIACGTDYFPMGVWKNPGTHKETLVGFFCDCCGNGFTVDYSLKDGKVNKNAATVSSLLSNASPIMVSLPATTDTNS